MRASQILRARICVKRWSPAQSSISQITVVLTPSDRRVKSLHIASLCPYSVPCVCQWWLLTSFRSALDSLWEKTKLCQPPNRHGCLLVWCYNNNGNNNVNHNKNKQLPLPGVNCVNVESYPTFQQALHFPSSCRAESVRWFGYDGADLWGRRTFYSLLNACAIEGFQKAQILHRHPQDGNCNIRRNGGKLSIRGTAEPRDTNLHTELEPHKLTDK